VLGVPGGPPPPPPPGAPIDVLADAVFDISSFTGVTFNSYASDYDFLTRNTSSVTIQPDEDIYRNFADSKTWLHDYNSFQDKYFGIYIHEYLDLNDVRRSFIIGTESTFLNATSNDVPEPSILALMGLGIFGLGLSRRKMKK